MSTRHATIVTLALALGFGTAAWAAGDKAPRDRDGKAAASREGKPRGERGRRPGGPGGPEGRGHHRPDFGRLFHALELNDDQKAEVKELMQAHGEEVKAYREANAEDFKAVFGKMKAAREAKDREAMKAAMEEMKALREGGPSIKEVFGTINDEILNDEQKKKFAEIRKRIRHDGPRPGDAEHRRRRPGGEDGRRPGGERKGKGEGKRRPAPEA
ncbi:MAG: hypothetical protein OER86_02580 [Phycisphaerae bacterium]|nr:hypothetical protein [Phycisphaerae bacterium]